MGKKLVLRVGVIIALALGVAFWLYQPEEAVTEQAAVVPTPPPPPPPLPVATEVAPPAVPVEQHPIIAVDPSAPQPPPPDIEKSEPPYKQALAKLFGEKSLKSLFYSDQMIRRFVATIDNLPRHQPLSRMMPVKPVVGAFLVDRHDNQLTIAAANDQRYAGYLEILLGLEARRLVDMYVSFYPVFQKAYRELGYPDGFFNDRLIEAIDDLLATPDVAPIALLQPKVLYIYADPALEARSAGQRIMLRMGAENRAKTIQALNAIRKELLSRSPAAG